MRLELIETAIMDDIEHAINVLGHLQAYRVKIHLDDFAIGYLSLAHLTRLSLNQIKTDKLFVDHLENDASSGAVTDMILALGHA